jgi:uncharacterized iron-regulated protein
MNILSTLVLSFFWVFESIAIPLGYYSGDQVVPTTLAAVIGQVKPGTVIVIGEQHNKAGASASQMDLLRELRKQGHSVSVGMEFISYPNQTFLEFYKAGRLPEEQFLKDVQWGGYDFNLYRDQILFPEFANGETTLALNAPRQLTGKIAKTGLSSLTADEQAILPPQLQLGSESYKKRFIEAMGGHGPSGPALDNYFAAHSVWDDTMAWQTATYMAKNPNHVFVIIVGEFHVQYGGGLPARLKARGVNSILTLSQVDHTDYSDEELEKEMIPHSEYGPRADVLWIF